MLRRLHLVALILLLGATSLAPQAACAAPATSVRAAMACCRTMKRCTTAGAGHRCCRQIQGDHEQPSVAASSAILPTRLTNTAQAVGATQLATTGEPSAHLVSGTSARPALSRSDLSPPRHPAVPVYILINTLLI